MPTQPTDPSETSGRRHRAGAFDIRNIIGSLLLAYGVILTLTGLLADAQPEKTGDVNANLWTGLCLLAFGAGFMTWARLRPVIVPETTSKD